MSKIFFYCDESGAKGYADNEESYPGETGVYAGIMIPEELIESTKKVFDEIAASYKPNSGKLHITDLPTEQKESLRKELFDEIKRSNLPCFWYAIHVAGLHAYHLKQRALLKEAKKKRSVLRGEAEPRIKSGSARDEPVSLHVEIFSGLYGHLIAFLEERDRKNVDIKILTDKVDSPIIKCFEKVASDLLDQDPLVSKFTGYDTIEKNVVHGAIRISVEWPKDLDFSPVVSSLSIETVPEDEGLILAADVIANSLNYLFKNRSPEELYNPLNCKEAVVNHSLAMHLDAFYDWGSGDLIGDGIYKHPKARS
jgi:hypothetical protein